MVGSRGVDGAHGIGSFYALPFYAGGNAGRSYAEAVVAFFGRHTWKVIGSVDIGAQLDTRTNAKTVVFTGVVRKGATLARGMVRPFGLNLGRRLLNRLTPDRSLARTEVFVLEPVPRGSLQERFQATP